MAFGYHLLENKKSLLLSLHVSVERKLFSETFKVGVEGSCLSFCGCVVDIPPGALSCETSICLSIVQVDPPDGICVTPILHCEPDGLKFNRDIEVTLPLNGGPYEPVDEANVPELELMVRGSNEERWCCDRVQKLNSSGMCFNCRHFSLFAWSWTPWGFLTGKFWYKRISCSLFEMKDGSQTTSLKLAICETFLEDVSTCWHHFVDVRQVRISSVSKKSCVFSIKLHCLLPKTSIAIIELIGFVLGRVKRDEK